MTVARLTPGETVTLTDGRTVSVHGCRAWEDMLSTAMVVPPGQPCAGVDDDGRTVFVAFRDGVWCQVGDPPFTVTPVGEVQEVAV